MDIVAGRSQGDNGEAELRKLEAFELEAQQREDEQSKRAEMRRSFESSQHDPNTTISDNSTGEEIKEEEKEDDISILKVVQDRIQNYHQVTTSKTPSAEAGCPSTAGDNSTGKETREEEIGLVQDELAFPQPRLACGQNLPDATMRPGAYTAVPGSDLQRTTTLSRSLVGATSSSHVEELTSNANTRNQSTADDQAATPPGNNNGLAVANQVEENEEPTQIARPDHLHGENKSTSMALMILVLIGSILVVGVIVGSICGAGLCSNKEGDMETQAPTSFRSIVKVDIQNRIEEAFGPDYFPKNDEPEPSQPKLKALDWIVFEDPMQLNPDVNNLLQRFILSLTYFQTSRESDWLACGPSKTANDETCWIDINVSGSVGSRWLTGVHECQWGGIYCDGEKDVTRLDLRNNGLNGPLPTELSSLSTLARILFQGNQLTGTVPSIYGSFLSLSSLNLFNNHLSGSIPVELFGNKLSLLALVNNSLTGTVPTEVGLFDGVTLAFGLNSLSGSLPTELFQTEKRIHSFHFNDNKLTGTLPTEIGALHGRNRVDLHLQGNPLRGTIPSEIGLLQGALHQLDISWTHMDGSLPEELFTECTNLVSLWVSNCGLTGTISTGLQLLSKLQWFDISNNKFHGTIPTQLSALTQLRRFIVNGNGISGSIPSSLCTLAEPTKRTFEVAADCLPRDGRGDPKAPVGIACRKQQMNQLTG
ncbi:LRR receptor-like serine threonine-protein kinase [Seminavis robusta]|uniref:LRR receptor-like serine threonine-protein kinase n=1 Tax=Seminavis robusta TaxID=568900 RepID=A0A9N8HC82_9STRA|nr:LRR receptor-like serine threonine-protein kinase [Seminavis robusta]|eukprot:Sro308_g113630.1 LRR receptor-like serine threonine-protein kinase (705) ;mRNA; r:61125-63614